MKIKLTKENKLLLMNTTAMLIAFGVLLPQMFHAIPNASTLISPMHIPVLLCGMICGATFGALCGLLTPVLSFFVFGMPAFPNYLVPMTFELCAYGFFAGVFFELFKGAKTARASYILSLLCSMIAGRVVYLLVRIPLYLVLTTDVAFSVIAVEALAGAFISSWLGVIIQIALIPALMLVLDKAHILEKYDCAFEKRNETR